MMRRQSILALLCTALGCADRSVELGIGENEASLTALRDDLEFANPTGRSSTFSTTGSVDMTGPFFQDLGTNGRRCVSCHQPAEGWTVTPAGIQSRFDATEGLDPIFRTNDGANSPVADVSTLAARRTAYSMLLTKGLIRVGVP